MLFLQCDVTFLNNSIFYTFCFIIENLGMFETTFGSTATNYLAILFGCHFEAKRHNKHIITRAEKYHIEIHNVTSHTGGGWVVLNL